MLAVLQLDAISEQVVHRLLAERSMPALAGLLERGEHRSIDVAMDDAFHGGLYAILYTGVDLGRHGVYYPFVWSAAEQRVHFHDRFQRPRTAWELIGERGRRSLVIDPYELWETAPTPGVTVSGWQARHKIIPAWSTPPAAARSLRRRFGASSALRDSYGRRSRRLLERQSRILAEAPGRVADATLHLLGEEQEFDLVWVTFLTSHQAGHHLWDTSDLGPGDGSAAGLRTLEEVYVAIDRALGRIVAALPEEADVLVHSPIGMGPQTSRADMLPDMLQAVLAGSAPSATPAHRARRGDSIWRMRARASARLREAVARPLPGPLVREVVARAYLRGVDWSRTRAFAVPGDHCGYVRLNLRGREREGIVDEREADELLAEIAAGLETFRDPDGSPSVASVERPAGTIEGPGAHRLPDLVVRWSDRPSAGLSGVSSESFGEVARWGAGSGRTGNHREGAWALVVPGASRPRELGRPTRLPDIAATACRLAGVDDEGLAGEPLLER